MNACPNCGMVRGLHASILPGCTCFPRPQDTDAFKPDWDTEAVLVEEMQHMAKRIEDLEMLLQVRAEQIVSLQDEIRNLTGEE